MLNRFVKVKVTKPIDVKEVRAGVKMVNCGLGEIIGVPNRKNIKTYVMGINYPIHYFVGKVVAVVHRLDGKGIMLIAAPQNSRVVNYEIDEAIAFAENKAEYSLECLYENSCGAVVYRIINNEPRFLLIKNNRSSHWGFPKGHMEKGETAYDTAKREVLEETGIHIDIIEGFSSKSEYIIGRKVQKEVRFFLATTRDTQTKIQREEIDDYIWLTFDNALATLNFQNDKRILIKAQNFMMKDEIADNG